MGKDVAEPEATGEDAEGPEGDSAGVGRFLYRLALAGVGGVVLAQEELSGLFSRKAEREPSEDESPALPEESEASEGTSQMEATVDRVLHSLFLPTRGDVEELSRKIEALAERIHALRG